jgi:hypothetical protein
VELVTRALALRFLGLASDTGDFKLVRRSKLPMFALSRVLERMELEAAEDLDLHTLARESGYSRVNSYVCFAPVWDVPRTNG